MLAARPVECGLETPRDEFSATIASHEAPVAQLDRVLPSEGRGHRFESCRARQSFQMVTRHSSKDELPRCPPGAQTVPISDFTSGEF